MRCFLFCLTFLCVVCLCACTKPPTSENYDPVQAPLTADELAQLAGFDHWKISSLPKSDKPYWGVRVIALTPENRIIGASTPELLNTSITAEGNNQILVGIQRIGDGFAGTLILGTRPKAVELTRFKFTHANDKDGGYESHIGLDWHNDQAELVRCVDDNQRKTFSINFELLHRQPD